MSRTSFLKLCQNVTLLLGPFCLHAQTPLVGNDYQIISRGPNSRVWQKAIVETNSAGIVTTNLRSYTELATGICYLTNGEYRDSVEQIEAVPGGAQAVYGRHKVQWAANANTPGGAVNLTTPDGKQLSSTVFGIAYYDVANGSNASVAFLQDCNGSIVGPNQVVYQDAFSNLTADLSYTYTKAGLSQNIVLKQAPPAPHSYGLADGTTVLQVYTEFFNSPTPQASRVTNGTSVDDQILDFGEMKMGIGQALFLNGQNAAFKAGPVGKQWLQVSNRTFLIESIPYLAISNQLQQLPHASNLSPVQGVVRKTALMESKPFRHSQSLKVGQPMKLSTVESLKPRIVVDYELLSGMANCTLQGDTTYLVSALVNITDVLTIEGGTVVKFTNSGAGEINVSGYYSNIVCQTGPYRPAVFTSMNDNSVGSQIGGSTGVPGVASTYINFSLQSTQTLVLRNLRFSYASTAISGTVTYSGSNTNWIKLWDCQFFDCETAFAGDVQITSVMAYLYNVLFSDVYYGVTWESESTGTLCVSAVNVTADEMEDFTSGIDNTGSSGVNSIFTDVYNLNGLYVTNCATNLSEAPYQTVGAGSYYLADNSPARYAGTTNIDPALLADLQTLTTYPPLIVTGYWFTNDYAFFPQAQRDTNALLDLGYHYQVLDYALNIDVSNATLTVEPGTALAMFGSSSGIWLYTNGTINSIGTATSPNYIVPYNTVQEQSNPNWETTEWETSILAPGQADSSTASFTFTDFSVLGGSGYHTYGTGVPCPFEFQNCQMYGGGILDINGTILSTNSLYQRVQLELKDLGSVVSNSFFNNLFLDGSLTFRHSGSGLWTFRDNLFDQTAVTNVNNEAINVCSNNAYVTTNYTLSNEYNPVVLASSPAYQTGALGQYYYPTNLTNLIHQGSELASAVGLYHYTVTTNNVIEGANTVSIGFHYVAVGTNGLPLISNTNDIPDYIADANGDGLIDGGEIAWYDEPEIITEPVNLAVLIGSNGAFSAVAGGTPPLGYQWRFNGVNITGGISSDYTVTNVQSANTGSYTVVVTNTFGSITSSVATLNIAGVVKWSINLTNQAIYGAPALGPNGDVYVAGSGMVCAINGTNGTLIWTNTLVNNVTSLESTPSVAANGTVYFASSAGSSSEIYAINPTNGAFYWTNLVGAPVDAGCAIANDGTIYVGTYGSGILAFSNNGNNGTPLYSSNVASEQIQMAAAPIIGPDCTVYGTQYGPSYLLGFSQSLFTKWLFPMYQSQAQPIVDSDSTIYCGSTDGYFCALNANGTLKWLFNTLSGSSTELSPVIGADQTLYFVVSGAGVLYALTNGAVKWAYTNDTQFTSPAVAADGTVYVGGEQYLYAVTNGNVEWTVSSEESEVSTPPTIGPDGTIYFATDAGSVFAVYGTAPPSANAPWPMFGHDASHTGSASSSNCDSDPCAPPVLFDGKLQTVGGSFTFSAQGPTNTTWSVYASSDGINWALSTNSVGLNYLGNGSFVDDDIGTFSNRYYYLSNGACSSEIIGFVLLQILPGTNLVADPFYQCDENWGGAAIMNTLDELFDEEFFFGSYDLMIPEGTIVEKWNGHGFVSYTNDPTGDLYWLPNQDATMLPGEGVLMLNPPTSNAFTIGFTGIVPQGPLPLNIQSGTNYLSATVPMAGPFDSVINYTPTNGDQLRIWISTNGGTNVPVQYTYTNGSWNPVEPVLQVGQGFVLVTTNSTNLVQSASPAIVVPPSNLTNNPGDFATFSVVAIGMGTLNYQWYWNDTIISNATAAQYTIDPVAGANNGTYSVTVTSPFGSTSASAVLYVPPDITNQPSVSPSDFTITGLGAAGTPALSYQWQLNGIPIPGATNSSFSAVDSGHYTVLVMNPVGTNLSVGVDLEALSEVGPEIANPGDDLLMLSPQTGTSYQWEWNGVTLCDTASSLTIETNDATNAGTYTVIATVEGYEYTNTTTLLTGPEIIVHPKDAVTPYGSNATFSVTTLGIPPFSYQWQLNGANVFGATNSNLVVSNATQTNAGSYTVILTSQLQGNPYAVTSYYAPLAVTEPIISVTTTVYTVEPGTSVSFPVSVSGSPGLTYTWYKQVRTNASGSWNSIALSNGTGNLYVQATVTGATNSTLTLSGVSTADSGVYRLSVYSPQTFNTVVSSEINLYVDPAITIQPSNQVVDIGSGVTFSVSAWSSNMAVIAYQWSFNGSAIPGANASSYSLTGVSPNDAGTYSMVVSNTITSNIVQSLAFDGILSVRTPIWITVNQSHTNLTNNFDGATTNGTVTNWYCASNAALYTAILTSSIPHIVHYDAGVFQTTGFGANLAGNTTPNTAQSGWQHWGNPDTNNPTTIQLLNNSSNTFPFNLIFGSAHPERTDGFELHDLILDCNANGPIQREINYPSGGTWGGLSTCGNNLLVSNVTFIHFGNLGNNELFPLIIGPGQGSEALDENSHLITLYSNITVEDCVFTTPATNNSTNAGLSTATILPGWAGLPGEEGVIEYLTNTMFKNCSVLNVFSNFPGWSHGFTALSVSNCVVSGCQTAVYLEVGNPVYYGQNFSFQNNNFSNVSYGVLVAINQVSPLYPMAVGNISIESNIISLAQTTTTPENPNPPWVGVEVGAAANEAAIPQIPSLTAQFNQISGDLGYPHWGFFLANISNALVTDNTLDNSNYGISMWEARSPLVDSSALRMPVSFLSAQRNTVGGQLIGITSWGDTSALPSYGTQQKGDFYLANSPTLLWRNTNTGQNVWWPMNGTNTINTCGPVASNWLPPMPTGWTVAATADFTGDCNNDIVWTIPGTTNVLLWTMQGPSFISSNWLTALPLGYGIAGSGDFNGDGKTDLVLTNSSTNSFQIWLMNGTNLISSNIVTTNWPTGTSQLVGVGPFNGGEQADILWRDPATGSNYVWNMSGTNFGNQVALFTTNSSWQIAGIGDFNGDGIADIVWRNPGAGSNVIWLTSNPLGTNYTNVVLTNLPGSSWTIEGPR